MKARWYSMMYLWCPDMGRIEKKKNLRKTRKERKSEDWNSKSLAGDVGSWNAQSACGNWIRFQFRLFCGCDRVTRVLRTARRGCCHTLKISAILRCCGREQWFSMDRMTGMSDMTNAERLTASTTSWGIKGETNFGWKSPLITNENQ